ncbi:MAG: BREX-1 system adenine-specific DNA-methyltransferase PglX [Acidiferrobacter sp.]
MDKDIRNAIERATQQARRLLEDDFAEQLNGTFDVFVTRRDGQSEVAADGWAENPGAHLDAKPKLQAQREKIVATLEHKRAAGMSREASVADYLRDAAFTTLNRFVALKMLEARELVRECVTRGEQSSGYREFCGLAPGVALLPDAAGYQLYIESLFDELSTEIKVLFDRRDAASVLWPKRPTFEQLLGILNAPALATVWGEDETIGWVYQYFNGSDERRKMREESQAPRNSRELAVRNQFFTPRYVVQFLTDNTLGRIWYEMRCTQTALADHCEYLVRKPGESFAGREKKDPRDLKVLDPACGSGHFLLYAFDLLVTIYEEAFADPESPNSEVTGRTLREDYPAVEALCQALPGLILAHNLHGVDIDARCAQIAQLALWMRGQRSYRDFGISREQRPIIRRSNIVVAEPLVADENLAEEFVSRLGDRTLGEVFKRLVSELKLAGEMGILLQIEQLVAPEWQRTRSKELFQPEEERIRETIERFVFEESSRTNTHRRLFAEDAAQGLGLLETVERKFDAVLMNPPFGDPTIASKKQVNSWYGDGAGDMGAAFVQRGIALLRPSGRLGAITNRTLLAVQGFSHWRQQVLEAGLHVLVDLGHGVLDAMVETAMYVCGGALDAGRVNAKYEAAFLGLLESGNKQSDLETGLFQTIQWRNPDEYRAVTGAPWAYWVPTSLLRRFKTNVSFLSAGGQVCPGVQTGDDFRFYRLRWEVPVSAIHGNPLREDRGFSSHRWSLLAKGGEYSLWWDDIHLVQDWALNGSQIRNFVDSSGKLRSRPQNLDKLFRKGTTFPYRTTSAFGLRLLPSGASISVGGWAMFAPPEWTDEEVLAVYNTRVSRYFMEVLLGQGDSSAAGTAARNHVAAAVGGIPWPRRRVQRIASSVRRLIDKAALETTDETALFFLSRWLFSPDVKSYDEALNHWWNERCKRWLETADLYDAVEREVVAAFELSEADSAAIADSEGPPLTSYTQQSISREDVGAIFRSTVEELTGRAKESCGAKRYTVKKAYFIDRHVDLACHILRAHPRSVIEIARSIGPVACGASPGFSSIMLSWLVGRAVGRFRSVDESNIEGPGTRAELPQNAVEEGACELESWVDDPGHQLDIVSLVRRAAENRWGGAADRVLNGATQAVADHEELRSWYRKRFFAYHLNVYSKSRRRAPIYWQLSTLSGSYSVWLAYHRLNADSLFKALNDLVGPKFVHEERRLESMRREFGENPSAAQRRLVADQERFVEEMRVFLEEVERLAPLWNPDLDDGVIINFAPLRRLVPQNKSWQKELEGTWEELCEGKYDWSHLAMHLWPERVVPKCAEDRSLAIAHGLEEVLWVENSEGKWVARETPTRPIDELIRERTSPAVKAALDSLVQAPVAQNGRGRSRSRRARTATA